MTMTITGWLDTYGEPQGWALAVAITEQIASYKRAAALLNTGKEEIARRSAEQGLDAEETTAMVEWAEDRVRKPVVDIERAQREVGGINDSGGWAAFVPESLAVLDSEVR